MAWRRPNSPERPTPEAAFVRARSSKTSMVEERRRENWRAVRTGAKLLVTGSWDGKMEMWRGLFCFVPGEKPPVSDSKWPDVCVERGGGLLHCG